MWKKVSKVQEQTQALPELPQQIQPVQKSQRPNAEELRRQLKELESQDLSPIIEGKDRIVVVREIPNKKIENADGSVTFIPVRTLKEKDGIVHFWTIEEALTEMLNEN